MKRRGVFSTPFSYSLKSAFRSLLINSFLNTPCNLPNSLWIQHPNPLFLEQSCCFFMHSITRKVFSKAHITSYSVRSSQSFLMEYPPWAPLLMLRISAASSFFNTLYMNGDGMPLLSESSEADSGLSLWSSSSTMMAYSTSFINSISTASLLDLFCQE